MASFIAFPERVNSAVRMSVACLVLLLFFILNVIVVPLPFLGPVKAPFFLMAIYYWAIYRPTLVPVWLVFSAGCLMDLLGGTPLGFNALIFVLTQWFVYGQRRLLMAQPFIVVWVGFASVYLGALLVQLCTIALIQGQWLALYDLGILAFFGIILFPPVCLILHMTHKILPVPRAIR